MFYLFLVLKMSTTTDLDSAKNDVQFFMGKLKEFPDIHSAGYIEYSRKLDGARETYNLLLRNVQPQGKYCPLVISSK